MIRLNISRACPAVAALALVATLTSGCSTFSDNNVAADVDGRILTIDELNLIAADFPKLLNDPAVGVDEFGEFKGDDLRNVLTRWVQSASLLNELDNRGIVIDDSKRADAAAQYSSTDAATWSQLSPPTQDFLVDYTVGRTTLIEDPSLVTDDKVAAAYEAGVGVSGVLCIRIMAFETEADAASVKAELDGGADFGQLANDHPLEPSAEPNDGVFLDQQSGSQCLAAANFGVLAQAVATTPVGESTEPLVLDSFYFLVLQRPFDEVSADARALIAPTIAEPALTELLTNAQVSIDSRYGMWDTDTGTVVPTR